MTAVTAFLTSDSHPRQYRAVQSEADAISRIRTAKVVQFNLPLGGHLGDLDVIFAVTNDAPGMTPEQLAGANEYRYDGATRSLSVGDVIHVEGSGIFSVSPLGWQRHDHRLTAAAAGQAVWRHATSELPR